jgi:hypothetical protein
MTIPAPVLPVVAGSLPTIRRKYPEICPGQNAAAVLSLTIAYRSLIWMDLHHKIT